MLPPSILLNNLSKKEKKKKPSRAVAREGLSFFDTLEGLNSRVC